MTAAPPTAGLTRLQRFVENPWFQSLVFVLILVNAVILGAETFEGINEAAGSFMAVADRLIIYAFLVEIGLRIAAYRIDFFKNGWNIFDFVVITISLLAATSGLGALRAFRVLRVLRVITVIPRMRVVVSALLDAIPGIASVGVVLALIIYVFAVIGASLYGSAHPAIFGDVFQAMYTLFQVMTLEGWPDIAAQVRETHPRSWAFFLSFVMIATFTMLNLFVAIVVRVVEEDSETSIADTLTNQQALRDDVSELKRDVAEIARNLAAKG